jgi:hypothetical protein
MRSMSITGPGAALARMFSLTSAEPGKLMKEGCIEAQHMHNRVPARLRPSRKSWIESLPLSSPSPPLKNEGELKLLELLQERRDLCALGKTLAQIVPLLPGQARKAIAAAAA